MCLSTHIVGGPGAAAPGFPADLAVALSGDGIRVDPHVQGYPIGVDLHSMTDV
jgi:hypothetical protein